MKTKVLIFLESLRSSFWFIPALMICAAMVISFSMVTPIISGQTCGPEQRKAIHRQANMIFRTSRDALPERNDKEDVLQRYRLLLVALNEFDDQDGPYAIPDNVQNI